MAPLWPRYGLVMAPLWPRYGPGMAPDMAQMAPLWPRYGPDMSIIWPRYSPILTLKRFVAPPKAARSRIAPDGTERRRRRRGVRYGAPPKAARSRDAKKICGSYENEKRKK